MKHMFVPFVSLSAKIGWRKYDESDDHLQERPTEIWYISLNFHIDIPMFSDFSGYTMGIYIYIIHIYTSYFYFTPVGSSSFSLG
jgi:hypothetical protein